MPLGETGTLSNVRHRWSGHARPTSRRFSSRRPSRISTPTFRFTTVLAIDFFLDLSQNMRWDVVGNVLRIEPQHPDLPLSRAEDGRAYDCDCSSVTQAPARTVLCISATASVTRKSSAISAGLAGDDTLARYAMSVAAKPTPGNSALASTSTDSIGMPQPCRFAIEIVAVARCQRQHEELAAVHIRALARRPWWHDERLLRVTRGDSHLVARRGVSNRGRYLHVFLGASDEGSNDQVERRAASTLAKLKG